MVGIKRWGCATLLVLLALGGCKKQEVLPEKAVLRRVMVRQSSLVVPATGSVELPFTVDSPDYHFQYDVHSADFQVRLLNSKGQKSRYCVLDAVRPGKAEGLYYLSVRDAGLEAVYTEEVCVALVERSTVTGNEVLYKSAYLTFRSERQESGPVLDTGLPVLYVHTQDGKDVTSKEETVPAELSVRGNEELPGLSEAVACSIRGRGNTTWTWPKKPYLLKLEKRTSLLGMPKHKRWILLANFMDRTLMRNLVSMRVATLTSLAWTPRCEPVELVLNGKHLGNYLLIEQVRIDENRVNISEEDGYILELDFHYDNDFQWMDPHGSCWQWGDGIPFSVKQPDAETLSASRKAAIRQEVSDAATALYGKDFMDPGKGYARYLDVNSFIDYWIVFEVMCNHELSNPGSVFFHKDKGGKLTAGPVWDFDWGVLSFYTSNGANGLVNGHAIWYARLMEDPAFRSRLKARFEELLPSLQEIPAYMDACEKRLERSAKLNFAMWNPADDRSQNGGQIINGDENLSFHDAITRLKGNYNAHLKVIQRSL